MRGPLVTRKTRVLFGLLLMALAPVGLRSQANLTYQNRGRFSEGIRTAPSTGPSLDLIAALIDYREPCPSLPSTFRALFFLPESGPVYLTIREMENRYFYWLDKVQPESAWQVGKSNRFDWLTTTVIRNLTFRESPLALDDLGAIARLGNQTPSKAERVVPVALYHSRPPQSVPGYRFVFQPGARMRLQFELFAREKQTPFGKQSFPSVLANQPHPVQWDTRDWPEGWYRMVVSGYALANNEPVNATVDFYHVRQLGN